MRTELKTVIKGFSVDFYIEVFRSSMILILKPIIKDDYLITFIHINLKVDLLEERVF